MSNRSRTIQIMCFIALSGFPFIWTWRGGYMQNPIIDLTTAICEHGRFTVDEFQVNTTDVAYKDGHYYSGMAPGISFLAIPVYGVAEAILAVKPSPVHRFLESMVEDKRVFETCILASPHYKEMVVTHFLMSFLFGSMAGAVSFLLVSAIGFALTEDRRISRQIGLIYAFGTVMAVFNVGYYTQSVALFMILLAVYFLFVRPKSVVNAALGALFAGIAGTCDYPHIVFGAIVAFFGFLRYGHFKAGFWKIAAMAVCFVAPFVPVMLYHSACFGSPLTTGYGLRAHNVRHVSGFAGISVPTWQRLKALFVSEREGILLLCPILVLAPFGFVYLRRRWADRKPLGALETAEPAEAAKMVENEAGAETRARNRLMLVMMAVIALLSLLFFISVPWRSFAASYGLRYALCAIPFLTIFSYPYHRKLRHIFTVLLVYSIFINHVSMLRIRPLIYLWDKVSRGAESRVGLGPVRVIPPMVFPWYEGLLLDIVYQAVLIGLVFGLPLLIGTLLSRRQQRLSPLSPGGSAAG